MSAQLLKHIHFNNSCHFAWMIKGQMKMIKPISIQGCGNTYMGIIKGSHNSRFQLFFEGWNKETMEFLGKNVRAFGDWIKEDGGDVIFCVGRIEEL